MPGSGDGSDTMLARIEEAKAEAERTTADSRAMAERLRSLSATGADGSRVVEVTVDGSGNPTGIKLSDRIKRQDTEHTAAQIIEALDAARAELAAKCRTEIVDAHGPDSPLSRALIEGLSQRLGTGPADVDGVR
jgi:DNA-binding protein YbaB